MKGYLFGLGAMVVGAGLMFVLMHGEVSADSKPERLICYGDVSSDVDVQLDYNIYHCETKTLDCAVYRESVSCVKKGIFKLVGAL